MPTASRRAQLALREALREAPFRFSFFQATRLLETLTAREDASNPGLGGNTPPTRERVRLRVNNSLSFPAGELQAVSQGEESRRRKRKDLRWDVRINFMGLTGPNGVLPQHYTELALKRLKATDDAFVRFLDLFHHRTLSLFYRAGTKYRLPIAYERARREKEHEYIDSLSYALRALIGIANPGARDRLTTPDEGLMRHAGLLTQRTRSSIGLKRMLEGHFGLPFEIREFKGQWHDLMRAARTRLPDRMSPQGFNNQLGQNALLGKRGWFAQGRFEILIGPLNREQFDRLSPGKPTLRAIDELVRFYVGTELDYDFVVKLHRRHIPEPPALSAASAPSLGWNTWIGNRAPATGDEDKHLEIRVGSCCRSPAH